LFRLFVFSFSVLIFLVTSYPFAFPIFSYRFVIILFRFDFVYFDCFPDFPFLLSGVVASLDQMSPSFSWVSLCCPVPNVQNEISEKPPTAAWSRCCLSTPHKPTDLLKIQSTTQEPMTSGFFAEPPIAASALLLQSSISWIVWLNSPAPPSASTSAWILRGPLALILNHHPAPSRAASAAA
jgi:hypothetical protein